MNFRSSSSAETRRLGAALAKSILKDAGESARKISARSKKSPAPRRRGAVVLALSGELGAGKTTFAQGFLKGLGVSEKTASPTFIIMREFALRHECFHRLYHIDVYRITAREAGVLDLKKIFHDPENIVLIEWAENIKKLIPKDAIRIHFSHKTKNGREITF